MTSNNPASKELDRIVAEVINKSSGRLPDAASKLVDEVIRRNDAKLILALVGDKLLHQLAIHKVKGAAVPSKTGARAAASGTGRTVTDPLVTVARPGAPNPAKPAGGGQVSSGAHPLGASPAPTVKPPINVREHFRRPVQGTNVPAVPAAIKGLVAMRGARALLATVRCGFTPLAEMKASEALSWAARQREVSTNAIQKSREVIARHTDIMGYDVRLAELFASNLPENVTVGQFYEEHPEEYQKRYALIVETGELQDA